jgi:hypothetical protein
VLFISEFLINSPRFKFELLEVRLYSFYFSMQSVKCGWVSTCLVDKCLGLFNIDSLLVNLLRDNIELFLNGNIVLLLLLLDLIDELLELPLDI